MCILGFLMIILVEINVKGFLRKCVKKDSVYGQNQTAEQLPLVKDIGTINRRKILRCNLKIPNCMFMYIRQSIFCSS